MTGVWLAAWSARWQRMGRRQQWGAFALAAVLVIAVVDLVAMRPLRQRLLRLTDEARATERALTDALVAKQHAEAVTRAFEAYAPLLAKPGTTEAALASVLSEVERAARQSGLQLLNLKPVSVKADANDWISVTAEAEATPAQLVQLLDSLQRSAQLLRVTELTARVSEAKSLRVSMVVSRLLLN